MARYSDEAWEMVSDSIDKKKTARSARSTRTHCGKSGPVKFPSDYMSKKDRDAMNGEVKSYRMNEPMTWDEFKSMPADLQKTYIENLREKFNVPDAYIAEMLGKDRWSFGDHLFKMKIPTGKDKGGSRVWNREGFMAWRLGVEAGESEPVPVEEKPAEPIDILDRPMSYQAFGSLTDEQKKEYIERLRKKFDVPNKYIGKMMGCSEGPIRSISKKLNIGYGRPNRCHRKWDEDGWNAWVNGGTIEADTAVNVDIPEEPATKEPETSNINETPHLTERDKKILDNYVQDLIELSAEVADGAKAKKNIEIKPTPCVPVIPRTGDMNFVGDVDDILTTLKTLLSGARVNMTVSWDIVE